MSNCLTELPLTYSELNELVRKTTQTSEIYYYINCVSYVNPFTGVEYVFERRVRMHTMDVDWRVCPAGRGGNLLGGSVFKVGSNAYTYWTKLCLSV
jgi:hypothetical protein